MKKTKENQMFNPKTATDQEVFKMLMSLKSVSEINSWSADFGYQVTCTRSGTYLVGDTQFTSLKALFLELVTRIRLKKVYEGDQIGLIKIVSARIVDPSILNRDGVFYIGGWSKKFRRASPLGNDKRIGHDQGGTRNAVIDLYKAELARLLASKGENLTQKNREAYHLLMRMAKKVKKGYDIVLVDWDFPLKSEAKVVKSVILYIIQKGLV